MEFTCRCPLHEDLATECGVPLAVACAPFPASGHVPPQPLHAGEVGRCGSCLGYVNRLCLFEGSGFGCALCGAWNDYTSGMQLLRYASAARRAVLPELEGDAWEAACGLQAGEDEGQVVLEMRVRPVFLALVDATGPPEFLDQVATALAAALVALPPATHFGLVLFSNQLALCVPSPTTPTIHHIPLLRTGPQPTAVELQDALPLPTLLANITSSRAEAQQCIDTALRAGVVSGQQRCAGPAVQAVLRYLAGRSQPGTSRVMVFLSGPPNARRGSVVAVQLPEEQEAREREQRQREAERVGMADFIDPSFPEASSWQEVAPQQRLPPAPRKGTASQINLVHAAPWAPAGAQVEVDWGASEFWEQAGAAAAALGVQVDVCAMCDGFVGLELIEPLCSRSGGTMVLYPSVQEATLPQDVYKRLSSTPAINCLMRVRCSPEVEATRCHPRSRAVPHEDHGHLFLAAAAAADDTFMFELRRTAAPLRGTPVVQLVSQYSTVQQSDDGRCVLRRWLRVQTVALPVASSPAQLWASCSPDALVVLMAHLTTEAAGTSGLEAAKVMLLDWLALLAVAAGSDGEVDPGLSGVEGLELLPRLAFGLLGSPLLQAAVRGLHPDLTTFVRGLWLTLPPAELATALYPRLSSWADADTVASTRHTLSQAALELSRDAPLLLLDTYWQLMVLLREAAPRDTPFPPPQQSAIRGAVDVMRQARRITPNVLMVREEDPPAAAVLKRALIEDGGAFVSMLRLVAHHAQVILAEEGAS